jgi:enterochelin esterase-like enzyme
MRAQMRGLRAAALFALWLAAGAAQADVPTAASPAEQAVRAAAERARSAGERIFELRFASPALAANVQGNSGEASVVVRLPPGADRCRAGTARCWLVLFLPGFDGEPGRAVELLGARLDALEAAGEAPPVVLVAVDGRTRLGGGFYVDSPSSGRFAAMILDGLLPAARRGLGLELPPARTIVAGHSMGGFGALWLALQRPHEFAGAAAFNPAAHTVPLTAQLLAAVDRVRGDAVLDPSVELRHPDPTHFRERLLWAVCSAFLPAPSGPAGVSLPFDPARRPRALTAQAIAGLSRFDLGRPLEGPLARAARALPRIVVTGGARDHLIPAADVEAVASALSAARGPGRAVKLVVRPDGDHGSRLADDFAEAVTYLVGER